MLFSIFLLILPEISAGIHFQKQNEKREVEEEKILLGCARHFFLYLLLLYRNWGVKASTLKGCLYELTMNIYDKWFIDRPFFFFSLVTCFLNGVMLVSELTAHMYLIWNLMFRKNLSSWFAKKKRSSLYRQVNVLRSFFCSRDTGCFLRDSVTWNINN